MAKEDFLIRKLGGQIEDWDEEVNKLQCQIDETTIEEVKSDCQKKISEIQSKITKAEDEILKLKDKHTGTNIPPIIR